MTQITALNYVPTFHNETYPYLDPTQPRLSTAGKTVFITGGGYGIGAEIARSFAKSAAANIILVGRTESVLTKTAAALGAEYPKTHFHALVADVTDAAAVSKAFETAISTTGAIDILVNNAGYLPEASPLVSADLETWWKGFEVNVLGVARVTQAFLRTKPHGRAGVVLTVNTGIAHDGNFPGFSSYASSKLAALRMIDIWQVENPEVRFVSIHPGKVDTAMFAKSGMAREGLTDVSLPADALVWLSSDGPEADFLKGKMFWVQWDVPELLEKKEKIEAGYELASGLRGLEGSVF